MNASVAEGRLTLVAGNDLDGLLDELVQVISHPTDDPFFQPTVVLPHMGVWRWMEQRLAQHQGVAMNVQFMLPGAWVGSLIRAWRPEWAKAAQWQRWPMTWSLMGLLQETLPNAEAISMADVHAACRYGDVFDAYQVWRPHWLKAWHQGRVVDEAMQAQAKQWRALHDVLKTQPDTMPDRAWVFEEALKWVRGDEGAAYLSQQLPTHFFALGQVDPRVMRLLHEVSRVHHCVWYRWAPSPHDFSRDVSSKKAARDEVHQPLSEAWSQLLADYGRLGQRALEAETECFQSRVQYEQSLFQPPKQTGVLGAVQRGLYALAPQPLPQVLDDSIQVHECGTLRAEVECLADALSDASQRLPDLKAHEVAILVPELPRYADVLREVLGHGVDGLGKRLDLVGARHDHGMALLEQFLWLLQLPEQRVSIDDVQGLMNHAPMRRALGVDETMRTQWKTWFEQAQTRWGVGRDGRIRRGAYASDKQTLSRLCDRLSLGYLMGAEDAADVPNQAPIGMMMEDDQSHALSSLLMLSDTLRAAESSLMTDRSVSDWVSLSKAFRAKWLVVSSASDEAIEDQAITRLDDVLHTIGEEVAVSGANPVLSRAAWVIVLRERLAPKQTPLAWLRGGINVGTLTPFRRMPFRFVAVLGLAQGVFPRPQSHQPEDLMVRFPERHDRHPRDEDRQTFLDTLLATKDRLHLSYVARSTQGQRVSPSPLLTELKRAMRYGFEAQGIADNKRVDAMLQHVWRVHETDAPDERKIMSVRRGWEQHASNKPLLPPQAMPWQSSNTSVDWVMVQSWLSDPQTHVLRQRHEARAAWVEDERHDTDQIELKTLQKHRWEKHALSLWQRCGLAEVDEFISTIRAEHMAAVLPSIKQWLDDAQTRFSRLDQAMRELGASWRSVGIQKHITVDACDWSINGAWQGQTTPKGVVFVSLGKPKASEMLANAWAAALLPESLGDQCLFLWLGGSGKVETQHISKHHFCDAAWLQAVMRGFLGQQPVCWHPTPSWVWLKAMNEHAPLTDWSERGAWFANQQAQSIALSKAQKEYANSFAGTPLSERPATRLLLGRGLRAQHEAFVAQTMNVVAPVWWLWSQS